MIILLFFCLNFFFFCFFAIFLGFKEIMGVLMGIGDIYGWVILGRNILIENIWSVQKGRKNRGKNIWLGRTDCSIGISSIDEFVFWFC
jgi:hypothetical protein